MEFIANIDDLSDPLQPLEEEDTSSKKSIPLSDAPPAEESSPSKDITSFASVPRSSSEVSPSSSLFDNWASSVTNDKEESSSQSKNDEPRNPSLSCILCLKNSQTSGPQTPYLLECGHILCASCLSNVSNSNDSSTQHQLTRMTTLRCAECFGMSSLPLTKHYALVRTLIKKENLDKSAIDQLDNIACEACRQDQAVVNCNDCSLDLCEKCDDSVHSDCNGEQEGHIRELIDLSVLCLDHFKGFELYCHTCSQNVCEDCTQAGEHDQHRLQPKDEVLQEQTDRLAELMSLTSSKLQTAALLKDQINEHSEKQSHAPSKVAINAAFEKLHTALQERRKQLLQEADDYIIQKNLLKESCYSQLDSICHDCEESVSLLNSKKDKLSSTFPAKEDVILPAPDYSEVVSRLKSASKADFGNITSFLEETDGFQLTLEDDVSRMQELIKELGHSSGLSSPQPRHEKSKKSRKSRDDELDEMKDDNKVDLELTNQSHDPPKKKKKAVHIGPQPTKKLSLSNLHVGQKIDCLDSSNRWAEAEILKIDKKRKEIFVSYIYWGEEWDEWVGDLDYGIAPIKTHTYYAGGPLEKGFRVEVLHDGVWHEGFVMDTNGYKIKVYYEDYSNTNQTKWVDCRDDCIRQFGIYSKENDGKAKKKSSKKSKKSKSK